MFDESFMKYYNEFAELYDELSMGLKGELEFYLKEAKKAKGPVLEVACGTGRILLPLLEAGVDIEGFDISEKMLSVLKKKAKQKGMRANVKKSDMRNFKSRKKYDLIIVPYRSFLHVEKTEDQIKTLKNFKRHLKKGGRLILNFFYPDFNFMAKMNGKLSKKQKVMIKGKMFTIQDVPNFEPINQLNRVDWFLKDEKGKKKKILKIHLCYIYKKEFELLLRLAGFTIWKVYGGFKKEKLTKSKQEMVWIVYV
jgi:ubiquinone/menaquinone biosynthesis C-methylase UbiE